MGAKGEPGPPGLPGPPGPKVSDCSFTELCVVRDCPQHKVCGEEQRLCSSVPTSDHLLEGYQVLQSVLVLLFRMLQVREFVNCFYKENTLVVLKNQSEHSLCTGWNRRVPGGQWWQEIWAA